MQDIWRDVGVGPSTAWAYIPLVGVPLVQLAVFVAARRRARAAQ